MIVSRCYSASVDIRSPKIKIGDTAEYTHKFTEKDVKGFADIVGDHNPVHFSDEFARAQNIFTGRIVHGMLLGGLISTVAGTILPGPGSIYLSQTFKFLKPAYIGDTITAKVKVLEAYKSGKSPTKNIFVFETICFNKDTQQVLVTGEARVLHPKAEFVE